MLTLRPEWVPQRNPRGFGGLAERSALVGRLFVTDVLTKRESRNDEALEPGTRVEVRSRFDGSWTRGFEVASCDDRGYMLMRMSDRAVLNALFAGDDIRPERRRNNLWWV